MRRLARHSLLVVERGFSGEDDETIVVSPVIEKVLPAARIAEMAERVKQYVGSAGEVDVEGAENDADREQGTSDSKEDAP